MYSDAAMHEIRRHSRRGAGRRRRARPIVAGAFAGARISALDVSRKRLQMAVSRALLLVCALAASVEGWSATPRAPVAAPLARSATAAVARPAAAAVRMEEKKSFLPFFLDVNTKGGIVFYSIVGIVAPFWAYGQMIDSWGFDVVTAGNVILIGYVGAGIVGWTSTCAARRARCGPRPPPLCRY